MRQTGLRASRDTLLDAHGPDGRHPHDLRHHFASVQIRGGQSIKVLQALLGHKSAVETWDTYGHLMGDEDTRNRAIIEALLGDTTLRSITTVRPNSSISEAR